MYNKLALKRCSYERPSRQGKENGMFTIQNLTYTDELGMWRKSQHSGPDGNCVEVAKLQNGNIAFRNSNDRAAGFTEFTPAEIAAFRQGVKDGEFDYLS